MRAIGWRSRGWDWVHGDGEQPDEGSGLAVEEKHPKRASVWINASRSRSQGEEFFKHLVKYMYRDMIWCEGDEFVFAIKTNIFVGTCSLDKHGRGRRQEAGGSNLHQVKGLIITTL